MNSRISRRESVAGAVVRFRRRGPGSVVASLEALRADLAAQEIRHREDLRLMETVANSFRELADDKASAEVRAAVLEQQVHGNFELYRADMAQLEQHCAQLQAERDAYAKEVRSARAAVKELGAQVAALTRAAGGSATTAAPSAARKAPRQVAPVASRARVVRRKPTPLPIRIMEVKANKA